MKIKNQNKDVFVSFDSLRNGECFINSDNKLYMKCSLHDQYNHRLSNLAVNLANGEILDMVDSIYKTVQFLPDASIDSGKEG